MNRQRLNKALKKAWQRNEDERWIYGLMGKIKDGVAVFDVEGRAGYVYVRIRNQNGAQTSPPARNDPGVAHAAGLAVRMRMEGTTLVIDSEVRREDLATTPAPPGSGVPVHIHDTRYFTESEHLSVSAGAGDAGKPIVLNASGEVDATMLPSTVLTDTDDLPEGVVNLYYTNERAQDAAGAMAANSSTVSLTYVDATPSLTAAVIDAELLAIAGLTSAADKGIHFTGSGTAATHDLTAFGRSLIAAAAAANARTTLGVVIGTDVQAQDAELAAIAGLTSAADRLPYFTGLGTAALATFTAFARTLIDDINDAAARTTLGLGTMAVEAAANYLLASGATPLTGEWDIGENMSILAERFEARDAEGLRIEDDGGNLGIFVEDGGFVGIGHDNPVVSLDVRKSGAVGINAQTTDDTSGSFVENSLLTNGADVQLFLRAFDTLYTGTRYGLTLGGWAEVVAAGTGLLGLALGTNTADPVVFGTNNLERMRILSTGEVGIGTATPQGKLHAHDGTGGMLFVTKTAVGATPVVIIPDGTGDVVAAAFISVVVRPSTGTPQASSPAGALLPGGSVQIFNSGANIVTCDIAANGQMTVQRTGGILTYTIAIKVLWL